MTTVRRYSIDTGHTEIVVVVTDKATADAIVLQLAAEDHSTEAVYYDDTDDLDH